MKRILVTGAGGAAAYNFIESLKDSRKKYFVVGTDTSSFHLHLSNAHKTYRTPSAKATSYIDTLNKIVKKENIDFIHPQPDIEVKVISKNRNHLNAKTFLPAPNTVNVCQNKSLLQQVLLKKNVPCPISHNLTKDTNLKQTIEELKKLSAQKQTWLRATKGAGSKASLPVTNELQAEGWIDYWKTRGLSKKDFMISEFLCGKEYAFQSLWKNGELIASQARERKEYLFGNLSPSGQSSSPSVAKTVHNKKVNEVATRAIRAIDRNASGVFCVDLKENTQKVPCVTEINAGRFFTTSLFFTRAGMNMPDHYIRLAFSEKIPKLKKYNNAPKDLYWIRLIDMGYKLIK